MSCSAAKMALKDISDYIENEYEGETIAFHRQHTEVWVVTPAILFTKHARRLNRQLGINTINYLGNSNGTKH